MSAIFRRSAAILLLFLCGSIALFAFKDFVPPKANPASTYPLKDSHPTEHVTVAIDVYDSSPKDDIFSTHYVQQGILPVFLVITNDGNQTISVNRIHAQLVTARDTKLDGLEADDIMRRIGHVSGSTGAPHPAGPITLPGHGPKNKKAQQEMEEINRAMFTAAAVEPHETQSGFVFFDIEGVSQPTKNAHFYLTGVRDGNGNELMYFEVPVVASNAATGGK